MAPTSTPLRESAPVPPRRTRDAKVTALGGGILRALVVAIVLLSCPLPWPELRLAVAIAGAVFVAVVAVLYILFVRTREHPRPSG